MHRLVAVGSLISIGAFSVGLAGQHAPAAFSVAKYPGYKSERVKAAFDVIYAELDAKRINGSVRL